MSLLTDKALAYVRANGDEVDQARLDWISSGAPVAQPLIDQLLTGQNEDGSFSPFWAPKAASIDATCYRLAQVRQVGAGREHAQVERAVQFLLSRQDNLGRWSEAEELAELAPPWAQPGDPVATLYLTANAGFMLAILSPQESKVVRTASWLSAQLDGTGRLPSFLHTHWLTAGCWLALGQEIFVAPVLRYLNRQLEKMSANNLSWMMTTLSEAGLDKENELLQRAADRLLSLQESNGSWPSDDSNERDVAVTLESLAALRYVARW